MPVRRIHGSHDPVHPDPPPHTVVDDPLFTFRGEYGAIKQEFTRALGWITSLGFPIAWKKPKGGPSLRWIGAPIDRRFLSITVPNEELEDLLEL